MAGFGFWGLLSKVDTFCLGLRFRVSGFGIRVSGFGFRVSSFGVSACSTSVVASVTPRCVCALRREIKHKKLPSWYSLYGKDRSVYLNHIRETAFLVQFVQKRRVPVFDLNTRNRLSYTICTEEALVFDFGAYQASSQQLPLRSQNAQGGGELISANNPP